MSNLSDVVELYRAMGAKRFFVFLMVMTAILVGLVVIHEELAGWVGWPERYGFRCNGRGCLWAECYHSYKLLARGSWLELLLFAWIWLIPGGGVIACTTIVLRRWWRHRHNQIRSFQFPD